jgi:hypothetical protein
MDLIGQYIMIYMSEAEMCASQGMMYDEDSAGDKDILVGGRVAGEVLESGSGSRSTALSMYLVIRRRRSTRR